MSSVVYKASASECKSYCNFEVNCIDFRFAAICGEVGGKVFTAVNIFKDATTENYTKEQNWLNLG